MPILKEAHVRRLVLLLAVSAFSATAQTKKIVVMGGDDVIKELQSAAPQARLVPVTHANVMKEIADADGFVGDIRPEEVRAAKKLQWVQVMSAGVEGVLFMSGGNDLRDSNIVVTNNKIVQGPEIADHAFAMLLSLSRGLPTFWAQKSQERLEARPYPGIELNGRTAVVI